MEVSKKFAHPRLICAGINCPQIEYCMLQTLEDWYNIGFNPPESSCKSDKFYLKFLRGGWVVCKLVELKVFKDKQEAIKYSQNPINLEIYH